MPTLLRAIRIDTSKAVKVDKALIAGLASDLKKLTILYKSLTSADEDPDGKKFKQVRQLFYTFGDNLLELVTVQVLDEEKEAEEKNWVAPRLRKTVWDLRFALKEGGTTRGTEMFPVYGNAPNYALLVNNRDANIRRYQTAARAFFEALTDWSEYMERIGESVEKPAMVEKTTLAGVQFIIEKMNDVDWTKNWQMSIDESLQRFLPSIEGTMANIRKAGFGAALDGMQVFISFRKGTMRVAGGAHASGVYDRAADQITLFPWAFMSGGAHDRKEQDYAITHEVGHRFWYRNVSAGGRAEWTEIMGDATTTKVTPESVDVWVDALLSTKSKDHMWKISEKDALVETLSRGADSDLVAHLRHINEEYGLAMGEDLEKYRAKLKRDAVGEETKLEKISDYAETNPVEAFAEAFRVYVTQGPAYLGKRTRRLFQEISRTGGAKISAQTMTRAQVVATLRAAAKALES